MADQPTLPATPGQPVPGAPLTKIGRFEIRRQLGEGSFGAVYLAYDPDLDREVALKIPGGMTPASRAEFLKEARAAAKVMHPNVCQVFEVSKTEDNPPFIVSRYVGGGTLADYIRKANGNLPIADALKIAGKIASGLAAAHAKGIVHRDLKPGNILYDHEADDFLITDFGLAKVLASASQSSGGVKGTPLYMSPEQFGDGETAGEVGPLSDVYALGVILYELLTGVTPFTGGNPLALMLAHIQTQPKPPSEKRTGLGTRYDALCLKALAKKADERFASTKDFGDAIRNALRPVAPPPVPPTPVAPKPGDRIELALQGGMNLPFGSVMGLGDAIRNALGSVVSPPVPPTPVTPKPGDRIELALPGGVKMPFAYCPPGEFLMGSPASETGRGKDELQHRVVISKGFWVGEGPVTRGQFARFVADTNYLCEGEAGSGGWRCIGSDWTQDSNCTWCAPGFAQTDSHPVVVVSWNDAVAFCVWVSETCQRETRLPTEAEWEYACRGGTHTPFYFGNLLNGSQANCDGSVPYAPKVWGFVWADIKKGPYLKETTPVGAYATGFPHPWGLCDAHGNVWEWCSDWYDADYYSRSSTTDPRCEDGEKKNKVVRGGSWYNAAGNCRSASRESFRLSHSYSHCGFRVILPST